MLIFQNGFRRPFKNVSIAEKFKKKKKEKTSVY